MPLRVLISAGESSGDLYASGVAARLAARYPGAELFGCAGPRMRAAGVEAVVASESLSVVGLLEVVHHIPRIYGEFRKLVAAARARRPDLAILTDSPDFNLRLARKLQAQRVPIVYLIAPQAWAWREGRVRGMRRTIKHLLCIFPFEEAFFRERGLATTYIGHPLARLVRPATTREEFRRKHAIPPAARVVAILPGSRAGEIARHLPVLAESVERIRLAAPDCCFLAGTPAGFSGHVGATFWERFRQRSINIVEGETWDLLAHADVALAASGTVTMEAAILGTPMVTFYRVSSMSWRLGRWLVRAPFLTMVNLIAGRRVVPELIQGDMTPQGVAREALALLGGEKARDEMRSALNEVRMKLLSDRDPLDKAVEVVEAILHRDKERDHVS